MFPHFHGKHEVCRVLEPRIGWYYILTKSVFFLTIHQKNLIRISNDSRLRTFLNEHTDADHMDTMESSVPDSCDRRDLDAVTSVMP